MMGVSRDTFYRYKEAVEEGGVDALLEKTRRTPNPKNRVEPHMEEPAHGQVRISLQRIVQTRGLCLCQWCPQHLDPP